MILIASIATFVAILWTAFVAFADGMSDATTQKDPIGLGTILIAWAIAIVLWMVCLF